jgi:hypothetical protein
MVKYAVIGGGVLAVGYLFLRSKNANAQGALDFNGLPTGASAGPTEESRSGIGHFADTRSAVGARALANNGSAGTASLMTSAISAVNNKNATGAGAIANKYLPGSGPIVAAGVQKAGSLGIPLVLNTGVKVGSKAASAIKKLKFW